MGVRVPPFAPIACSAARTEAHRTRNYRVICKFFQSCAGAIFMAQLARVCLVHTFPPMRPGLRGDVLNSLLVLAGAAMLFLIFTSSLKW
jgi:hypothetical protein